MCLLLFLFSSCFVFGVVPTLTTPLCLWRKGIPVFRISTSIKKKMQHNKIGKANPGKNPREACAGHYVCVCVSIVYRGLRVRAGVTPRQRLQSQYLLPAGGGKPTRQHLPCWSPWRMRNANYARPYDAINAGENGREYRICKI